MNSGASIRAFIYGSRGDGREGGDDYFDVIDPMMKNYNRIVNGYYFVPDIIDHMSAFLYGIGARMRKGNRKKLLLHDGILRYPLISGPAFRSYDTTVIGTGIKPIYDAALKHVPYYSTFRVSERLFDGIINDNDDRLIDSVDRLGKIVKKIDPCLLVLYDAALPYTRAMALVAREAGIPSVVIQHGIYQKNTVLKPEADADYSFVWGNYFKRLFVDKKVKPADRVKVLGYPYEIYDIPRRERSKISVYYFGQNIESINYRYMNAKLDTLAGISRICEKAGFDFTYRPHPAERYLDVIREKISGLKISENETLNRSLANGDIFIALNSTALIQASLHSRFAVQLRNYPVETDDFEEIGMCAKSCDNMYSLESYLLNIRSPEDLHRLQEPYAGSDYIEIPSPDPGTRFLELAREIIG
jgi:hypothetical protein